MMVNKQYFGLPGRGLYSIIWDQPVPGLEYLYMCAMAFMRGEVCSSTVDGRKQCQLGSNV